MQKPLHDARRSFIQNLGLSCIFFHHEQNTPYKVLRSLLNNGDASRNKLRQGQILLRKRRETPLSRGLLKKALCRNFIIWLGVVL